MAKSSKSASLSKSNASWSIGFAEREITPPPGRKMSGYGRVRFAEGTIAPLYAQALAIRGGDGKVALLLTADVIGFDRTSVELIRSRIAAKHAIPHERILIASSHTHWGPSTLMRINPGIGGFDVWTVALIETALVELAESAIADLTPASLEYTSLQFKLGQNRRLPTKDGIAFSINEAGHYDTNTPVLRARREYAGETQDILVVGHACHPTSTGGLDRWSPDYPGAMRDAIRAGLGSPARAMFVMGFGADAKTTHVDPKTGKFVFSGSPEDSRRAGERLATAVLNHLKSQTPLPLDANAGITCGIAKGTLTRKPALPASELHAILTDTKRHYCDTDWARLQLNYPLASRDFDYEVQAWRFGDTLTVIALEGEVCSPLGPLSRALARTKEAMTIGYANQVHSYIPTAAIVREGGYEGDSSHRAYGAPAPYTEAVEKEVLGLVKNAVKSVS